MTGVIAVDPIRLAVPSRCRVTGPRTFLQSLSAATRKCRQTTETPAIPNTDFRVFHAGLSNTRLPHALRVSQFALFLTVGQPSPALDAVRRGGLSPSQPRSPVARVRGSIWPAAIRLDWSRQRGRDD